MLKTYNSSEPAVTETPRSALARRRPQGQLGRNDMRPPDPQSYMFSCRVCRSECFEPNRYGLLDQEHPGLTPPICRACYNRLMYQTEDGREMGDQRAGVAPQRR